MNLKYYETERARWPVMRSTRCSFEEATLAVRRLQGRWPIVQLRAVERTRGVRNSHFRPTQWTIRLNTDHLNWLTVVHEFAHALHHARTLKALGLPFDTTQWVKRRKHGKAHARLVDTICDYVISMGWHTGSLAHALALRDEKNAQRARIAAMPPPIETKIAHREKQIARLERNIRNLTTRKKTAARSLAALRATLTRRAAAETA